MPMPKAAAPAARVGTDATVCARCTTALVRLVRAVPALAAALVACGGSGPATFGSDAALADSLSALIAAAYDFSRPDVAERMAALYAETGTVVSASAGHVVTSRDSLRAGIERFWQEVGRNMREPRWEWGETHATRLGDDAAVLTATWRIPHIAPDGHPHVIGGAWTAVFQRTAAGWAIVHEHISVP